jgi:magnesium chelatase family protein
MTLAEAIKTTRMHRVAGLTGDRTALVTTCLFRAPHDTISHAGLIGGGHVPMPGDMLQAHRAMLFLHRRLEGKRSVVEALRLPLHDLLLTPEWRRAIANASPG